MDLTSRKYSFIERFMSITNVDKIERLEKFLNAEIGQEEQMPEILKHLLDRGMDDVNAGRVHSSEDVQTRIKEKYGF